jgi:diguanylate cyclase (GGDEF)-like protein
VAPKQVVIELTENESFVDRSAAWDALLHYRELGFGIAIDDLGEGFASLRLWSELRPEYVKIDRHFVHGISRDPLKLQMARAIQQIAQISGSTVIAEGIEEVADFLAVRDLGIRLGQGYLVGRPLPEPDPGAARRLWEEMSGKPITAFPEPVGPISRVTARTLARVVEPVAPGTANDLVFARFEAEPTLAVIPVVEHGAPRGIINRLALVDRFARPYRRELYGKRPCSMFMNSCIIVDIDTPLQEISFVVSEAGQAALADGFVVTQEGRYAGVGAGHDLMREITEQQITAARYANPLTLLPGNVPIAQHFERLVSQACRFAACYCDLDSFKPYNDIYGYQRGDEMIQLTAKLLAESCEPAVDFLGHVGGDDFVLIFQSADWEARSRHILAEFDRRVRLLFSAADQERGCFVAEDRRGNEQQFALTSLSIGVVPVEPGTFASHYEISTAAAEAKKQAKRQPGSSLFVERRQRAAGVPPTP